MMYSVRPIPSSPIRTTFNLLEHDHTDRCPLRWSILKICFIIRVSQKKCQGVSEMSDRIALIIGASGSVGSKLIQQLLAEEVYGEIYVWLRSKLPIEHPKLKQVIVALDKLEHLHEQPLPERIDDLFCCLGTTIKKAGSQTAFRHVDVELPIAIANVFRWRGLKHYLIVTAIGADENSRIFYSKMKGIVEQQLRQLEFSRLTIIRPSLLLAKRNEFRFTERLSIVLHPLYKWFLLGPLASYRPILSEHVASVMVHEALDWAKNKDGTQAVQGSREQCEPLVTVLENQDLHQIIAKHPKNSS
jgi:uncharacterized protein YbjT (DUF2867 family)